MANRPGEVIPAPDDDLCLGYANTRYWRGSAAPTEDLHTLDDLLRWAETAERLPPALVQRFHRSTDIFSDAMGLRETIFRCFAATASGDAPAEDDLAALNAALAAAPARQRVRHGGWDIGTPAPSAGHAAGAGTMVGGGPAGGQSACARAAVRQSAVWLAVPRQQQERQPALVFDECLRQSRQGAPALSAAEGGVGSATR